MAEDDSSPPLARRVPGASRPAPSASERPVLPEALLQRMQAVVSAARAQAAEEQRLADDDTSPLPHLTASGATASPVVNLGAEPDRPAKPHSTGHSDRAVEPDHALRRDQPRPSGQKTAVRRRTAALAASAAVLLPPGALAHL